MDKLLESIKQYVIDDAIDYGIMLDGEWGSGKTYFWEKVIIHILKTLNNDIQPCYVSLFGVNDQDAYKKFITSAIATYGEREGWFNKALNSDLVATVGKNIAKHIPIIKSLSLDFNSLDILKHFGKRFVFCIDDIERSNISNKLLFGIINQLSDELGFHVIALCNEKMIHKDDDYLDTKEKSIHYTFKFQYGDIDAILMSIINDTKDVNARNFLSNNAKVISKIIHINDVTNLRIIKRIIYRFAHGVYPSKSDIYLKVGDDLKCHQRLVDILIFMMACIIEIDFHKRASYNFATLKNQLPLLLFASIEDAENSTKYNGAIDENLSYEDAYYSLYDFNKYDRQAWFDSIFEYITLGYLDRHALISEIYKFYEKDLSDLNQAIDYIKGMSYSQDDDDLSISIARVKQALNNDEIEDVTDFLHILRCFKSYIKNECIDMNITEMYSYFDKAALHICGLINEQYDFRMSPHFRNDFDEKDMNYISSFNEAAVKNMFIQNKAYFSNIIASIQSKGMLAFEGPRDVFFRTLGLGIEHSEQLGAILHTARNHNISVIRTFIRGRYCLFETRTTYTNDLLYLELPFLKDFLNRVTSYKKSLAKSIRLNVVSVIEGGVKEAINMIERENEERLNKLSQKS